MKWKVSNMNTLNLSDITESDIDFSFSIELRAAIVKLRVRFGRLEDYDNLTTEKNKPDWKTEGF